MNDWDIELDQPHGRRSAGQTTDIMHHAARLARRDPQRRGNVIYLPPRGQVIITGDMHGCRENFDRIVNYADLGRNPNCHLILHELEHGGPLDEQGGCRSFELIEQAAELKVQYPSQVHILLANHDVAELLDIQLYKGSTNQTQAFRDGLIHAYGDAYAEVKEAYCEFFKALPLAVRTPNRVWISHSTPHLDALPEFDYSIFERELNENDFHRDNSVYSFLWGRNQSEMAGKIFARHMDVDLLIVGHQPSQMGFMTPTSWHIVLYSDNKLGRFLEVPLDQPVNHYMLSRQIRKIIDLPRPAGE